MTDFGMRVSVDIPLEEALRRTRTALAEQGFGILTVVVSSERPHERRTRARAR